MLKLIISSLRKMVYLTQAYPLTRGMVSYSVTWPLGSVIQQTLEGYDKIDFGKVFRFSIYGTFYVAPSLTVWMSVAAGAFPSASLGAAITRALVEQIMYTPFAIISFYFLMSLLERKTIIEAKEEVQAKFLSTYKVGCCVWPILQTINHTFIHEKNRIVYVSICSLMWTSFLSYLKNKDLSHFRETPVKS